MDDVRFALIGACEYLNYEMYEGNNIFVISTGAANEINASGYNLEGRANYIRTKIGDLFQAAKRYPNRIELVYVIGISNQQNEQTKQSINFDFNSYLSNVCEGTVGKFIFLGGDAE